MIERHVKRQNLAVRFYTLPQMPFFIVRMSMKYGFGNIQRFQIVRGICRARNQCLERPGLSNQAVTNILAGLVA